MRGAILFSLLFSSPEFRDKCPNATSSPCIQNTRDCEPLKPCEKDEICCGSRCGTVCHKLQEESDCMIFLYIIYFHIYMTVQL